MTDSNLQQTIDIYESLLQAIEAADQSSQTVFTYANKKIVTDTTTKLALDLQKAIVNCRRDAQFNLKELYRQKAICDG